MTTSVVGRASDSRVVADFLAAASEQPSGLGIEGEAGIGKTTRWLGAEDRARGLGFQVLSARAVHAESSLAYAALADLLRDVPASDRPEQALMVEDGADAANAVARMGLERAADTVNRR